MSVATKQEEDVSIQISKLHGHKGSVLCLDFNENDDNNETSNSTASSSSSSLLLSGSEDCTARLWDIRDESTKRRASLCIRSHGEVLSVAFSPREPINNNNMGNPSTVDGKTELSSPFSKDHTVYVNKGGKYRIWKNSIRNSYRYFSNEIFFVSFVVVAFLALLCVRFLFFNPDI